MNYPSHWLGHDAIRTLFLTALQQGRLGHGYIFDGPEGIGKSSLAVWIAAHLFCQAQEKPCGRCAGCLRLASDNHPDLLVVQPEEGSIKNHQVEAFQYFLGIKPFLAEAKVAILVDADTMTVSAQNRLLKTLEEPPAGSHIFLITTNFNRLVPTVLSRCQTIRFQPLEEAGIASYLANHYNIDRVQAEHTAALCGGSLGRALALQASGSFGAAETLVSEWLSALERKDRSRVFELADQYDGKVEWEPALDWLVLELGRRMKSGASLQDMQKLARMGGHVEDALKALREQANDRIVIDVMLLRMQEVYYD